MVSRNFLGNFFSPVGTPPIGNGDLLGFWLVLGPGHLEKFRARAKNRKMLFPGARGTFEEKICLPQKFLPEIAQLFYVLCFGRPEGRDIAKYWLFGATLAQDSPWHLENFWAKKQTTGNTPDRVRFSEVKPGQVQLVLRWATTWEHWGQNRPKPVFLAKIDKNHFFRPKSIKTSFSSQKPAFLVKLDQNQFSSQNRPKPVFLVNNQFFWPKSIKASFFGQN